MEILSNGIIGDTFSEKTELANIFKHGPTERGWRAEMLAAQERESKSFELNSKLTQRSTLFLLQTEKRPLS